MFKKTKTDSKVRFQRRDFRKQLQQARGYKRTSTAPSQQSLWQKIGLGSWQSKTIVAVILAAVIYIVYIPNFLYVKNVQIVGASADNNVQIQASIRRYFSSNYISPQKNLLLLSQKNLADYLKNNNNIVGVRSVTKKFPNTLIISIQSRQNQFLLTTNQGNYIVSNDGIVTDETVASSSDQSLFSGSSSSSLVSGLTVVKLNGDATITPWQVVFNGNLIGKLNTFQQVVPPMIKMPFDHFELTDFNTPDLALFTQPGLKVYFDLDTDSQDSLQRLQLLLNNIAPSDLKKLSYIDLRFQQRAYICFKGKPCDTALDAPLFDSVPTSTPDAIPTPS